MEDDDDFGLHEKEKILESFTFAKYVVNGVFNPLLMLKTVRVIEETPTRQIVQSASVITNRMCKTLRFNKLAIGGTEAVSVRKNYELLKSLRHPNIVWTYHFYEDVTSFYLIQDYFTHGNLITYFNSHPPMTERISRMRVRELLGATKYIQMMGMDFIDFSLSSLAVDNRGSITIDDVNFVYDESSQLLAPFDKYRLCFIQGTVLTDDIRVSMKIYGEILFLLLTGKEFSDENNCELLYSRSDVSKQCKDLVLMMLTKRNFQLSHLLESDWMNCRANEHKRM